jgi:hypothetical protein
VHARPELLHLGATSTSAGGTSTAGGTSISAGATSADPVEAPQAADLGAATPLAADPVERTGGGAGEVDPVEGEVAVLPRRPMPVRLLRIRWRRLER